MDQIEAGTCAISRARPSNSFWSQFPSNDKRDRFENEPLCLKIPHAHILHLVHFGDPQRSAPATIPPLCARFLASGVTCMAGEAADSGTSAMTLPPIAPNPHGITTQQVCPHQPKFKLSPHLPFPQPPTPPPPSCTQVWFATLFHCVRSLQRMPPGGVAPPCSRAKLPCTSFEQRHLERAASLPHVLVCSHAVRRV